MSFRTSLVALLLMAVAGAPSVAQERAPLPDLADTELTLKWADFKRLVEAAQPRPTPPPALPAQAFLRAAEYRGQLDPGILELTARLELELLAEGWAAVPLWSAGALVAFTGNGAVLHRQGEQVVVLAEGPRSLTIEARLVFVAPQQAGENRLSLRLPDAALNLLEVEAARGIDELTAESGLVYQREDRRLWLSLVDGTTTLRYTIPFARRDEVRGEELTLEPRVLVTAYQLLNLGGGVVSGALVHDYQVRVAAVDHFDVVLGDGVEVFDVSMDGLESWRILERDTSRVLHVNMAAPVDGALRMVVSFEASYEQEQGKVQVPRFVPLEVEREAGFVAVAADGSEVQLGLSGNLLPADVSEVPAEVRGWGGNLVTAFKYAGAPDPAVVAVTEHEDAAVLIAIVDRLNATTVMLANGVEASWLDLVVKNNRKQFLKLELPAGSVEIWSLLVDGEPARPKHTGSEVLVPLPTAATEVTANISLVLLRRGEPFGTLDRVRPYLPRFDLPISEAMWTVYLPPDRLYSVADRRFSVVEETAPLALSRRRAGRGRGFALAAGEASAAYDRAVPSAVSDDTVARQKKQEAEIQQYYTARQGAARKGALPVRIGLPGGIQSMAKLSVARILVVDESATELVIRCWPRWLQSLVRWLEVLLLLAASVAAGLLLAGRLARRASTAALVAAALWIAGWALGAATVIASALTIALVVSCVVWLQRRRARRSAVQP